MVRVKHRYLLLNILFPTTSTKTTSTATATATAATPAYVHFRSPTPSHITPALFISALRHSIVTHFGDCGLGLTTGSLKLVYFSPATATAIVRCPRAHYRIVWAALTYVTELPSVTRAERGKECVIQVVRVSGTIRKSEEELLRRARMDLVRARSDLDGDDLLRRVIGHHRPGTETALMGAVASSSSAAAAAAAAAASSGSKGRVYQSIEDPDEPGGGGDDDDDDDEEMLSGQEL